MGCNLSLDSLSAAEACFIAASQLLYCEPDYEEVTAQVVSRQFESVPFAGDNPDVAKGLALMDAWCKEAAAVAAEAPEATEALAAAPAFRAEVDTLRREWLRLFVGLGTPEASCLESFYVEPNSHMFGKNTLAVREAYRAYGLQIERLHHEPDDHLGLMLGFVSRMIGAEADSLELGRSEDAAQAAADQETFLTEHILPWLPAWRYNVKRHAKTDYYRGCGDFVFGLCAAYAERFGISYDDDGERFVKKAR